MDSDTLARIRSRVKKTPRGCWIAPRQMKVNGTFYSTKQALFGALRRPTTGQLLQVCGESRCVHPQHLCDGADTDSDGRMNLQLLARFMRSVRWADGPLDTPCLLWTRRPLPSGYGQLTLGTRSRGTRRGGVLAHRLAYEHFVGPIPGDGPGHHGWCVCHHCDVRLCVNPKHLFLGTHQDNVEDMLAKERGSAPPRHIGSAHPQSKLTESQVLEITKRRGAGETLRSIAEDFGISLTAVSSIASGKTWGWLTGLGE